MKLREYRLLDPRKWLLVIVSIIASVLTLEISGAVVYYIRYGTIFYARVHEALFFTADRDLGYRSHANIHVKKAEPPGLPNAPRRKMFYDIDTDAFGFRYGGILTSPKPSGEIRIFCLGGSTTYGAEVPNRWTYPQQLNDLFNNPSIKVINAGVGGYRSIHLLKYYQKIIRKLEPDIITIYEGWNDYEDFLFSYWKPRDPTGHALLSQQVMLGSVLSRFVLGRLFLRVYFDWKNYNRVEIGRTDEEKVKVYNAGAVNPTWRAEYEINLQELIKSAQSDDVVPVLIIFPAPQFRDAPREAKDFSDRDLNMAGRWDAFVTALDAIRGILRKLAAKNDVPVIDADAVFDEYNKDYKAKFALFVDRMHLTREGNRLVAEVMYRPMKRAIEDVREKRKNKVRASLRRERTSVGRSVMVDTLSGIAVDEYTAR